MYVEITDYHGRETIRYSSGHLSVKKGYYYCVLSFNDELGKRKTKWISTCLSEKGNKKK